MHRNPSAEFKLLISDGKFGGKKSLLIKVVKLASLQEFNLISLSLAPVWLAQSESCLGCDSGRRSVHLCANIHH